MLNGEKCCEKSSSTKSSVQANEPQVNGCRHTVHNIEADCSQKPLSGGNLPEIVVLSKARVDCAVAHLLRAFLKWVLLSAKSTASAVFHFHWLTDWQLTWPFLTFVSVALSPKLSLFLTVSLKPAAHCEIWAVTDCPVQSLKLWVPTTAHHWHWLQSNNNTFVTTFHSCSSVCCWWTEF